MNIGRLGERMGGNFDYWHTTDRQLKFQLPGKFIKLRGSKTFCYHLVAVELLPQSKSLEGA